MLGPVERILLALMLVVLMFGMGTTLTPDRFRDVLRHPKAFLIGTSSQFVFMPTAAFVLAKLLSLPDEVAIGLVIMGSCPGGTTSNLYAHLAGGDVALSIAMTAASKVLGIVAMPLALYVYARPFSSAELTIPYKEVVTTLLVLLVPVTIGMMVRRKVGEAAAKRAERIGSLAGVSMIAMLVGVSFFRNGNLIFEIPMTSYLAAAALGVLGLAFGDGVSRLAGLPRDKRRAVSFETGVQNSPLCFAIIVTTFPPETQDVMLRLPLIYALFVILEASALTIWIRARDRQESAAGVAIADEDAA